jgi:hypothetical protein
MSDQEIHSYSPSLPDSPSAESPPRAAQPLSSASASGSARCSESVPLSRSETTAGLSSSTHASYNPTLDSTSAVGGHAAMRPNAAMSTPPRGPKLLSYGRQATRRRRQPRSPACRAPWCHGARSVFRALQLFNTLHMFFAPHLCLVHPVWRGLRGPCIRVPPSRRGAEVTTPHHSARQILHHIMDYMHMPGRIALTVKIIESMAVLCTWAVGRGLNFNF